MVAITALILLGPPPAGAQTVPPGDAWVQVEGDMVVPAALARAPGARLDGQGFLTYQAMIGNLGSYDIRLVDSTGVESVRPEVAAAAAQVEAATGGDVDVVSGLTGADEPARGEILVVVSSSSPCASSPWIGCGGVQSMTGTVPNLVAASGKVWLHPDLLDLSEHNRQHVVSHELGHALGLRHYDATHDGDLQVMHSSSYDARSYRSGDLAGLQFLHNGGPSLPNNDTFAAPYLLDGALPTSVTGTNIGATRETGEPAHAGDPGGASVWASWTAPAAGEVAVEVVAGTFDTVLAVYRGASIDGLTGVASNDDGPNGGSLSATRFAAQAGVTYRIAVDGAGGDGGRFTLRVRSWVVGSFSSDVAFVERQYRDFLGDDRPTLSELLLGVEALQTGEQSAADMIVSLARHGERVASLGPVTRLYLSYFQRTPETAGLEYWIGRHMRGSTLSIISSTFATSSEFTSTYGDLGDRAFVRLVYRNVLDRSPDRAGEDFWVGQLGDGRGRGWMMIQFSESDEHVRDNAAEVDVVSLRLGMLRSMPSADLFEANVRELERGNPLQQIAARLLAGDAYAERVGF